MPTLEWIGKEKVINHHQQVPYRVLEEKYTYNAEKSDNMIIRGDNLEALKALLPQYEGKVKCIYIDPPYNTGNEGWVYNDNVNDPKIKKWLGEVVGKEGEDLSRHDKWLCMMYPRLKLLQKLLAEDGAIFISIDDTEFHNLRAICNEIFGENNFITTIIWHKNYAPKGTARHFSEDHDYILVYAKDGDKWVPNKMPRTEKQNKAYKNYDNDPRGLWRPNNLAARNFYSKGVYSITCPSGRVIPGPPAGSYWRVSEEKFWEMDRDGRIWWGKDGNNVPAPKIFLSEVSDGIVPQTLWEYEEVGHTQDAKKEIKKIFEGDTPFDTPKPYQLIERILQIATNAESIILDSFAGSGTTAHAVLNMNKTDGGHRQFILVEMMDYADSITAERAKRVIDGYGEGKSAVEGTGGSFTFYDLGKVLLLPNGNLNEDVPADKIQEYVYYMETKEAMTVSGNGNPYFLGSSRDTAYYFFYEKDSITTLDHTFLATIPEKAEGYIIYADLCTIPAEELAKYNITFKKIPRDIAKL
ncbi:MAG: site-specific DNA-methyltransferase [Eubacteriales bacterium]|nr:site-specific DNA-methyltransferase [Eubacteriales bacterium]